MSQTKKGSFLRKRTLLERPKNLARRFFLHVSISPIFKHSCANHHHKEYHAIPKGFRHLPLSKESMDGCRRDCP